jgi:hypothetical protein
MPQLPMTYTLIDTLTRIGKPPTTWKSHDGSTVLVLPYGGRILGLFAPDSDRNFFWTHPALESVDSADAFYRSTEWHNSGGDRTWLSPEVDFFRPNYPSLDTYFQPREFDPGAYELTTDNGKVVLVNSFSIVQSRSKQSLELRITKRLGEALNPLRELDPTLYSGLKYAGFTLQTQLDVLRSTGPAELNLWSLLQLPHGGELIIPTFSRSSVMFLMGEIGADDLVITDQFIRYKMRAKGEHKIGVSPLWVAGRVGYLYPHVSGFSLIIRNFAVNPSAKYLDTPLDCPDGSGAAVQACNVNSRLGAFSELEYHAPGIGGATGVSMSDDSSQVWAFYGPHEAITSAARLLLCPALRFN